MTPLPTSPASPRWGPLIRETRAGLELAALLTSPVAAGIGVPRGDAGPVLVVPAFLGGDDYLGVLRGWLGTVGYVPYASGLWLAGASPLRLLAQLERRTEAIAAAAGRRVTLIGHSLGGVLARALATRRPALVRHVVSLGAPVGADPRLASRPLVRQLSQLLLRDATTLDPPHREAAWQRLRALCATPLAAEVRATSIYTREDAIADWRACVDPTPGAAAYAVPGTHLGLVWNRRVYQLLGPCLAADRRADPA
jgi:triacylglycerol lipase